MPALLLTNNRVSIPTLVALSAHLEGIYTTLPAAPDYDELVFAAAGAGIPLRALAPEALFAELAERLAAQPGLVVLSFGLGAQIPADLLTDPDHRFYNVHFSLLPHYAGPVPLFWQLRNGDARGGITLHQVAARLDAGPIALQREVPLYPGETYGLYNARLMEAAVPLVRELLQTFSTGNGPALRAQDLSARSYQGKPREKDLLIDWQKQTAIQIEQLVNACNPIATGAWTWFRGQPLQLLEVSPAQGDLRAPAGTIVHADGTQGLFVCCSDNQLLRINVVRMPQGILSGQKLVALGFRAQERFGNAPVATPTVSY